jgi:hypothetical protein
MAVLEHVGTGIRYPLASRMLVGRSHACHLRVESRQVSGVHAELAWDGERWSVHDLGSRNGTHVDGQRLPPEQRRPLPQGAQLTFGTAGESFVLVDASPPRLLALGDDGRTVHAEAGLLCLPSEDEPAVTLLEQPDGRWLLETEDDVRPLAHEERIVIGGRGWRVLLPGAVQHTDDAEAPPLTLTDIVLELAVSRDEEHVQARMIQGSRVVPLRPRAHDFFLVTLARARLADQRQPALPEAEHGWVYRETLARRLRVDRNLLNLWIYRARRQFAEAGLVDVTRLVERRLTTEQLRIGAPHLRVVRC